MYQIIAKIPFAKFNPKEVEDIVKKAIDFEPRFGRLDITTTEFRIIGFVSQQKDIGKLAKLKRQEKVIDKKGSIIITIDAPENKRNPVFPEEVTVEVIPITV
jgi:hypothetical protein